MRAADFYTALREAEQRLRHWPSITVHRSTYDLKRCWANDETGQQCTADTDKPVGLCARHIREMQEVL